MDLESNARGFANMISDSIISPIMTNPICVALVITCVIMLIIAFIYSPEGRWVKTGFYIALTCVAGIFIHNKLLLIEHRKQLCSSDATNICNIIGSNAVISGAAERDDGESEEALPQAQSPGGALDYLDEL